MSSDSQSHSPFEPEEHPPYYGKVVVRDEEHQYIDKILSKYRDHPVNDELKKKIWDDLMIEKHLGHVTIPFKVVLRKDPMKKYPDTVEIILDTKV